MSFPRYQPRKESEQPNNDRGAKCFVRTTWSNSFERPTAQWATVFFFPRIQVTEYKAQGNGWFARFKKHKWRLTKHEKGMITHWKGHSGNGCFARFQWAMILYFFPKRNGHEAQRNRGAKRSNEIDSEKWLRKVSCKFLLCLMAR